MANTRRRLRDRERSGLLSCRTDSLRFAGNASGQPCRHFLRCRRCTDRLCRRSHRTIAPRVTRRFFAGRVARLLPLRHLRVERRLAPWLLAHPFVDDPLQFPLGDELIAPRAKFMLVWLESQSLSSALTSLAGKPLRAAISSAAVGPANACIDASTSKPIMAVLTVPSVVAGTAPIQVGAG